MIEIIMFIIGFLIGSALEYRFQFFIHLINLVINYERPPKVVHDVEIFDELGK